MLVLHLDVEEGIFARYVADERDRDPDGGRIVRCNILRQSASLEAEPINAEPKTVDEAVATIASIAGITEASAAHALLYSQPGYHEHWEELTIRAIPLEEKRPTLTTAMNRAMHLSRTLADGYAEVIDDNTAEIATYRDGQSVDPSGDKLEQAR